MDQAMATSHSCVQEVNKK